MRVCVRGDRASVVDGERDVFRRLGPRIAVEFGDGASSSASAGKGTGDDATGDGSDVVRFHLRADRARARHRVVLCEEMCATAFVASARCKLLSLIHI